MGFIKSAVERKEIIGGKDNGNEQTGNQDVLVMICNLEYKSQDGNQQCCRNIQNPEILHFNASQAFFKIRKHRRWL